MYWDHESGNEWGMMGAADVWFRLHGLEGMSSFFNLLVSRPSTYTAAEDVTAETTR